MSKAQLETFKKPTNQVRRISNREKIYRFFKIHQDRAFTIREAAKVLRVEYRVAQPRISELFKSGLIKEDGTKEENGQTVTRFTVNMKPALFPNMNKGKFDYLKQAVFNKTEQYTYAAIMEEFERLYKLKV